MSDYTVEVVEDGRSCPPWALRAGQLIVATEYNAASKKDDGVDRRQRQGALSRLRSPRRRDERRRRAGATSPTTNWDRTCPAER